MRGWGGGAVFLAMQVLEIPAGGRGFPLVSLKHILLLLYPFQNLQLKISLKVMMRKLVDNSFVWVSQSLLVLTVETVYFMSWHSSETVCHDHVRLSSIF